MVAAFVAAACASPPDVQAPPTPLPAQAGCVAAGTAKSLCIVILGDSIAEGVPVAGDARWWPRLQRLLASALPGRTVEIDSWAVSGSQVAVLESAARDQPAVGTFDLAIVIEGVNDEQALPVDAWRPRYENAIAGLEAQGLTVILATPPPSFDQGAFGPRYDATAAAVRDVAGSKRPLFDLAARWHSDGPTLAATYYVDYVHQSEAGQVLMAAIARDVVLKAIGGIGQK
jgi:lysophospholipase L1-like esterase